MLLDTEGGVKSVLLEEKRAEKAIPVNRYTSVEPQGERSPHAEEAQAEQESPIAEGQI